MRKINQSEGQVLDLIPDQSDEKLEVNRLDGELKNPNEQQASAVKGSRLVHKPVQTWLQLLHVGFSCWCKMFRITFERFLSDNDNKHCFSATQLEHRESHF